MSLYVWYVAIYLALSFHDISFMYGELNVGLGRMSYLCEIQPEPPSDGS